MENIESYVKWRGDITLEERDFNEMDNLVFSTLVYLDVKHSVTSKDFIPLNDLYARVASDGGLGIKTADKAIDRYKEFLFSAARSARFGSVVISDYIDIFDEEKNIQFAAMVFHLDKHRSYIAFRGTDETIIGWKEDFIMSFQKTASHDLALKYTNAVLKKYRDNTFYLGGHSKGGNLALYAAANLSDENWARIEHLYINDGPGLSEDVFGHLNMDRIVSRTTKIVPAFCVIGKLFDTQFYHCKIVKSAASGIAQHDIITWKISDGELDLCHENSPQSIWINQTLEQWLANISMEERRTIVDGLFKALCANGAVTLQDLAKNDQFDFENILRTLTDRHNTTIRRKLTALPIIAFFDKTLHRIKDGKIIQTLRTSPLAKALAMILFGILFLIIPEVFILISVGVVLFGMIIFNIFVSVRRLIRSGWNFKQNQPRIYTAIILLSLYAILIVKQDALFILSSAVFGIGFLCTAYNYIEHIQHSDHPPDKVWYIIRAVLFLLMGLSILAAPASTIQFYSIAAGIVFIIDGIYRLIRTRFPS